MLFPFCSSVCASSTQILFAVDSVVFNTSHRAGSVVSMKNRLLIGLLCPTSKRRGGEQEFFQIILEIVSHSSCLTCDGWRKSGHILSAHKFKSCFIQFFGRSLCLWQFVTGDTSDHSQASTYKQER